MRRVCIVLNPKVEKLDINKLVNVLSGLNNLKIKLDDIDIDMLKIVVVDLKKLRNVASKEVLENMVYNKLNIKVSNLESKNSDASTLIQINQYNTD